MQGGEFAALGSVSIEPVLCDSPEQLERESERLRCEMLGKQPVGQKEPKRVVASIEQYQYVRDAAVVAYVLNAAGGICDCCRKPAPFAKSNGAPYLEVHHVKPLALGGSDTIMNAVAICPNCHRELHHGRNSEALAKLIYLQNGRLVRE